MAAASKLSERVVLVTGSSSGIGRATAVSFGQEEARVAITYHSNREGAEETGDLVHEAGSDPLWVSRKRRGPLSK